MRLVGQQVAVAAVAGDRLQSFAGFEYTEELVPLEVLQGEDVTTKKATH